MDETYALSSHSNKGKIQKDLDLVPSHSFIFVGSVLGCVMT